jgi:hypothetical protein
MFQLNICVYLRDICVYLWLKQSPRMNADVLTEYLCVSVGHLRVSVVKKESAEECG